jgi:hypothetical protein
MARRELNEIEAATVGAVDFSRVARMARWDRLAAYIHRRWKLPPWVSRDDVRQDLMLEAWQKIAQFDPARGVEATRYVEWNAITYAKKRGHKARGSYRHRGADSAPSRYELAFTSMVRDGDEDGAFEARMAERTSVPPEQHEFVERREAVKRLEAVCESPRELVSVRALGLAGGDIGEAARILFDDVEARYELRLGSEHRAEQLVASVVRAVVARLDDAAA